MNQNTHLFCRLLIQPAFLFSQFSLENRRIFAKQAVTVSAAAKRREHCLRADILLFHQSQNML